MNALLRTDKLSSQHRDNNFREDLLKLLREGTCGELEERENW